MAGKNGVSLHWNGLDQVLGNVGKRMGTLRNDVLHDIGETLVSNTKFRFRDGKDPEGHAWEPSARAWEQGLKDNAGRMGKTLIDTGDLRRSITHAVTQDGVLVGSNKVYARIHQEGGKAGRGRKVTIPARPFLGFNDDDREDVADLLRDYFHQSLKG